MIPTFPNFRHLSADDKPHIDSFTKSYKPYSDFVFSNLWIWDIEDRCQISSLHGNLVVLFYEYATKEYFLSFLGTNNVENTALELLSYAEEKTYKSLFNFLPEESVVNLTSDKLHITEDPDDFDYIYSISDIAQLRGNTYKSRRHLVNQFKRQFPLATFVLEDIRDPKMQTQLISLMHNNRSNKTLSEKSYYFAYEESAFKRLLALADTQPFILSCLYQDEKLIGYSVDEVIHSHHALSHFFIVDYDYKGVYDYLNTATAKHLGSIGVAYWNWAEDLGIANLRKSKLAYRPSGFLKMYSLKSI